jgi:hypothetical protein
VFDDLRDRAFASGLARLRGEREDHLRAQAALAHRETRALRGPALRRAIEAHPPDLRDHFVEELLDIAYTDGPSSPEYVPSHVAEILHAFDAVDLGPGDTLIDVGSGLGKVVMLAGMLTGARARGIELDATLAERSRRSATALGLDDVTFEAADALGADIADGTVFFLYIPFSGAVLERFLDRLRPLAGSRRLRVCAAAVDAPWLRPIAEPTSWLSVYEAVSPR